MRHPALDCEGPRLCTLIGVGGPGEERVEDVNGHKKNLDEKIIVITRGRKLPLREKRCRFPEEILY
jgi:hypothetical protein